MIKHNFCAKVSAKIILKVHQIIQAIIYFCYKKHKTLKKLSKVVINFLTLEIFSLCLGLVEYAFFSIPTPHHPILTNLSMTQVMLLAHGTIYSMALVAWLIVKIRKPMMRFVKKIVRCYKVNVRDEIIQEKLKNNK